MWAVGRLSLLARGLEVAPGRASAGFAQSATLSPAEPLPVEAEGARALVLVPVQDAAERLEPGSARRVKTPWVALPSKSAVPVISARAEIEVDAIHEINDAEAEEEPAVAVAAPIEVAEPDALSVLDAPNPREETQEPIILVSNISTPLAELEPATLAVDDRSAVVEAAITEQTAVEAVDVVPEQLPKSEEPAHKAAAPLDGPMWVFVPKPLPEHESKPLSLIRRIILRLKGLFRALFS